ncbi:MAG: hypothetical protein IKJ58_11410 [Akkermansia sp.]|nr:hypothetical protein [Akkermansia sp.]
MGFAKPSTPAVDNSPAIVSEVIDSDAAADYDQKASRRKGLLSTILSARRPQNSGGMKPASTPSGNDTLG